jgi:predicted anti-sigma-YlaC factor YlaD
MNCKSVKENLVFFLENELPEERRIQMENHLKNCPDCSRLLEEFSPLWQGVQQRERIQPSPYFWTPLKQKITEYEQGRKPVFGLIGGLIRLTRPAVAVAATLICIFLGYSLGNFPQQVNGQTVSRVEEGSVAVQELFDSDYLDPLTDFPSGSIEATYLEIISEE